VLCGNTKVPACRTGRFGTGESQKAPGLTKLQISQSLNEIMRIMIEKL